MFSSLKNNDKSLKYLDWLMSPLEKRYFGVSCDTTSSIKQKLYSDSFKSLNQKNGVERIFQEYYNKVKDRDALNKMLYVDTKTWLPDDLLTKADKMTMATSVELRVPFLDHKFVEFAASIPSKLKISGKINKYIFKKAMEGILPNTIIYRKKRGFPIPINQWFGSDLNKQAADILLDRSSIQRGYFNEVYLAQMLQQQKDGKADYSRRIFSLLVLELWHQIFVDESFNRTIEGFTP